MSDTETTADEASSAPEEPTPKPRAKAQLIAKFHHQSGVASIHVRIVCLTYPKPLSIVMGRARAVVVEREGRDSMGQLFWFPVRDDKMRAEILAAFISREIDAGTFGPAVKK